MTNKLFIIFLLLLTQSCYKKISNDLPKLDLPKNWYYEANGDINNKVIINKEIAWWKNFKDPILDDLIEQALKNNSDIMQAMINVSKAQIELNLSKIDLLPNVALSVDGQRTKNSKENFATPGVKPFNAFTVKSLFSYQIDLWGKIAAANDAAKANLLAEEYNRENVYLTIASEVASSYINLLGLNEQIKLLNNLINAQREIFRLKNEHYNLGNINKVTLNQFESNLLSSENKLLELKQKAIEQTNALGILVGKSSKNIFENEFKLSKNLFIMPLLTFTPEMLPINLIQKRPDIKSAEQNLYKANIDLSIIKKAYLPDLTFKSFIGLNSNLIEHLLKDSAKIWQLDGNLTMPIIDSGLTKNNIKLAEVNKNQYILNYRNIVRNAIIEVNNSLAAKNNNMKTYDNQKNIEKNYLENRKMASLRYESGYAPYFDLLNADIDLYNVKIEQVSAYQNILISNINVIKALGGDYK